MARKITPRIRKIIEHTIEAEGGFVNDPDDLGGATKYGWTLGSLVKLGIDLDGDGDTDVDDVKLITKQFAMEKYADHYYFQPNIDRLPVGLQETVFDMQVLSGVNAGKCLQRLINASNRRTGRKTIAVDGGIGTNTIAHCKRIYKNNPKAFIDCYGLYKISHFLHITKVRPGKKNHRYVFGWITRRGNAFISKKNQFDTARIPEFVPDYTGRTS